MNNRTIFININRFLIIFVELINYNILFKINAYN